MFWRPGRECVGLCFCSTANELVRLVLCRHVTVNMLQVQTGFLGSQLQWQQICLLKMIAGRKWIFTLWRRRTGTWETYRLKTGRIGGDIRTECHCLWRYSDQTLDFGRACGKALGSGRVLCPQSLNLPRKGRHLCRKSCSPFADKPDEERRMKRLKSFGLGLLGYNNYIPGPWPVFVKSLHAVSNIGSLWCNIFTVFLSKNCCFFCVFFFSQTT